jgi:hypothetical protein
MYICVYVCMYTYIYIYIYIYMQGGRLLRGTETETLVGALQQPPASQPATQPAVLLGVTLPPPSRAKKERDEPGKNTKTGGFKSDGFKQAAGGGGGGSCSPPHPRTPLAPSR